MGNDEAHALAVVGQFKCYLNDEHCTSNAESSASSSPLLQTVALAMHVTTSWSLKVKKGTHRDTWHLYQPFTLSQCTEPLHTYLPAGVHVRMHPPRAESACDWLVGSVVTADKLLPY